MAEPQPTQIKEGDQAPTSIPSSNRSETAALDSLDQKGDIDSTSTKKDVDTKALGNAMQNLSVENKTEDLRKNVKVEAGDVALLVDNLDISKSTATELLKAHDADAVKAMRAWISA